MSRRSKRRHRQEREQHHAPRVEQPAAPPARSAKGGTKGRTLLIGGAAVVVAAVLYAVSAGGGRKGGDTTTSLSNAVVAAVPSVATFVPPLLPATAGAGTGAAVAAAAGVSGPKMQFATPIYDFGKVKSGELVKYTYVFTNVGGATLQVSNVQVTCGCTTAGEWTHRVDPGQTGGIPIQFNTAGYGGAVGKSITVTCNDTNQPAVVLQIKGNVWKPIDVTPQFAVLNLTAIAPSNATTVRIVNNEQVPLTLSMPECNNRAFAAELKTNQPGKEFEMVVWTVSPLSASVQGQITLKTSSTNVPVINVTAWANVQQEIMVMPSQISLPAVPLASSHSITVSIRNNGTNTLELSEPEVSEKSVDLQLKEIQAGRLFALTANFPAGFEIAEGKKLEVSMKSNHPQFANIKVPVMQPYRPAPAPEPRGLPAAGSSRSK